MKNLKVERIAITSLVTDPSNVRRHPDRNVAAIKSSLNRFGQQHPIVVDSKNIVRVGNGRLEAMKQLGWTECWVVRTDLSDADLAAYAIADNRTSELASWDLDGLDITLKDLNENGINLEDIGFSEGDLASLLGPSEWKKAEKKGQGEASEKEYTEKIVVVVSDMTKRAAITLAIKDILEKQGWTEHARVI
jgi:ParB-like chromosome segregation protein Spo0J